jgi:hypothetical protein
MNFKILRLEFMLLDLRFQYWSACCVIAKLCIGAFYTVVCSLENFLLSHLCVV